MTRMTARPARTTPCGIYANVERALSTLRLSTDISLSIAQFPKSRFDGLFLRPSRPPSRCVCLRFLWSNTPRLGTIKPLETLSPLCVSWRKIEVLDMLTIFRAIGNPVKSLAEMSISLPLQASSIHWARCGRRLRMIGELRAQRPTCTPSSLPLSSVSLCSSVIR